MSRYLYKKIQNISPEWLNFQHSGLKLTTLESDPERFSVKTSTFCSCNAPQSRLFSIKRNDALTAAYGNDNEAIFSVKVDQKRA